MHASESVTVFTRLNVTTITDQRSLHINTDTT